MLKEALEFLVSTLNKSNRVTKIDLKDPSGREVYFHFPGSPELSSIELAPTPRNHVVHSIDSFCRTVEFYAQQYTGSLQTVWVTKNQIIGVLDDTEASQRLDTITLPVEVSPVFSTIKSLTSALKQEALVSMLRTSLKTCEIVPERFKSIVEAVKWTATDQEEGNYQPSKSDSFKRSVHAEVAGVEEFPEEVEFSFSPYPSLVDEIDQLVSIRCGFQVFPKDRTMQLTPLPGQVAYAEKVAMDFLLAKLGEKLDDSERIFCGVPS